MPCNSDYLEPRFLEAHSKETAQHLLWLAEQINFTLKPELKALAEAAAAATYGNEDLASTFTEQLCIMIRSLTPEQREQFVDSDKPTVNQRVQAWWKEHDAADKAAGRG